MIQLRIDRLSTFKSHFVDKETVEYAFHSLNQVLKLAVASINYFNVRNIRVQKFSRISRMTLKFAKLNGPEKNLFGSLAKINSAEKISKIVNSRNFSLFSNLRHT